MRTTLAQADGVSAELARYRPGEWQARHRDGHSRISLTLRGSFAEESGAQSVAIAPGDVLYKSREALHSNCYGPEGATVVSLTLHSDAPLSHHWQVRRDARTLRHALTLLYAARAKDAAGVNAAAADLLADTEEATRASPPRWLASLKDEMESETAIDVSAWSRKAGVHPAHLSRLFRRCYGSTLTEHAQAASVRRALGFLAQAEARLCEIALAAGFYDQSHMCRVFRRVTGRSPAALRALMAG
jgi:AraC family transcriptional regulator